MSNNFFKRPEGSQPQKKVKPAPAQKQRQEPSTSRKTGNGSAALTIGTTIIKVVATVTFCIFLAIFILKSASDLFGLNQKDTPISVTIPEGMDFKGLTKLLTGNGIVEQEFTFNLYSSLQEKDVVIKPGTYTLNTNMAYDQIFVMLRTGDLTDREVRISFPEGLSLDEIAQLLEEKGVCGADDFLDYLQTADFSGYSFYNMLPKTENRYLKLEGYLFPDTYDFFINEKISSVADKFLSNFDRHMNNVDTMDRIKVLGMTLDEVVTLASIIQKESDEKEMRRVSSVFHNRLDNASTYPNLQTDVTINYVEDHIKDKNRYYTISSTQDVFDAYNTNVRVGLPAGPVCSPGEEAIKAALHPAETNNYYFVTDYAGKYYFATTLAEHNANVEFAKEQDETGEGRVSGISTQVEGEAAAK